jgi:hypothetical protein
MGHMETPPENSFVLFFRIMEFKIPLFPIFKPYCQISKQLVKDL